MLNKYPADVLGGNMWIQTASGHPFPIASPEPDDFRIHDIAHHLSRLNRYTGAIRTEFYTVGEHSVRVAYYLRALVARELKTKDPHVLSAAFRAGLMHDAHEAYLNDLSSPLKRVLKAAGANAYAELADQYDAILAKRYALATFATTIDLIREADLSLLDLERPNVMGTPPRPWSDLGQLPKVRWVPDATFDVWGWSPNLAKARFLRAAAQCGVGD